jgi:WD40 repeat protein
MGVVYRARQRKADRVVALKMILAGGHAGPDELARFRTEAEAIARLQHPNIVQIFEVGDHAGRPFFSLELCPGGGLDRQLAGTPLPPREAAALIEKLARAIHAAHQKGILHRDLKPANVLLAEDGTPKISDFGLAKKLDPASTGGGLTATGAVMGTPSYIAPEQAGGDSKRVGPGADVYALGAILYECLTGRPPFKAASPMETLMQVVSAEPVRPRQLNAGVPRDLETICLKCLHKDPARRYATAEALAEDLRRFESGRPIAARRAGPAERLVKWVRRNPAVVAVMAALVLGAGAATYFAVQAAHRVKVAEAARHGMQLEAAVQAWKRGDTERAEAILRAVPPEFADTWEQRHVEGLCLRRKPLWSRTSSNDFSRVAYSPGGDRIVSGTWNWQTNHGAVQIWDAHTGREILSLKGIKDSVYSVAFSPDGKRIVSGSNDGTLKLWDAQDGHEILALKGPTRVVSVAFSSDGSRIASAYLDRTVKVWDAATGQEKLSLRGNFLSQPTVAFCPDGKCIVVSGTQDDFARACTAEVWDAATGEVKLSLLGHTKIIRSAAYSPDGKRIVTGSWDRTVRVWDAETGEQKLSLVAASDNYPAVQSVAFSPDGKRIAAAGGDGVVKVWDAETGEQMFSLKGHRSTVESVSWGPDGKRIASAGGENDKTLNVWNLDVAQEALTLKGHSAAVTYVAMSPDGDRIASGSEDRTVKIWDALTGQEKLALRGHTGEIRGVAWSSDGKRILSGSVVPAEPRRVWGEDPAKWVRGSTLKVWNAETGKELLAIPRKEVFSSVAWGPAGEMTFVTSDRGGVLTQHVWDEKKMDWRKSPLKGPAGFGGVAYSPDGKRFVWARSDDKTLQVWDAVLGLEKLTLPGHTDGVTSVAWSPDGRRIISGSKDGTLKIWEAADTPPAGR